jgi:hypothetical protein
MAIVKTIVMGKLALTISRQLRVLGRDVMHSNAPECEQREKCPGGKS